MAGARDYQAVGTGENVRTMAPACSEASRFVRKCPRNWPKRYMTPISCLGRGSSDFIPGWGEMGGSETISMFTRSIDAVVCSCASPFGHNTPIQSKNIE